MKRALTITLTLISGFGANFLAVLGLTALALFEMDLTPIWFAAAIAVIAAFTALLHFVRKKLTKFAHGAVIILCAQLPPILLFWSFLARDINDVDALVTLDVVAVIIPAVITVAAFIAWALSVNKDRIKKWWNEPL